MNVRTAANWLAFGLNAVLAIIFATWLDVPLLAAFSGFFAGAALMNAILSARLVEIEAMGARIDAKIRALENRALSAIGRTDPNR